MKPTRSALALLWLAPSLAVAQSVPSLRFGPPDASVATAFHRIIAVRELLDGRVLISDRISRRISVADFKSGLVSDALSVGNQAGGYRGPSLLSPLTADSTIASDAANRRWVILNGTAVAFITPPDAPAPSLAPMASGADDLGRVLGRQYQGYANGRMQLNDSTLLLLVARATGRADTIARLLAQPLSVGASTVHPDGSGNQTIRMSASSAGEQAILFADGWIAIARLNPYRVDWRTVGGQMRLGAPLPFARSSDELPPFTSSPLVLGDLSPALNASPDGNLVIARMTTAGHPEATYDVVDRTGSLIATLSLSANERLMGFGAKSAYVVLTETSGIQQIRRYHWPVAP